VLDPGIRDVRRFEHRVVDVQAASIADDLVRHRKVQRDHGIDRPAEPIEPEVTRRFRQPGRPPVRQVYELDRNTLPHEFTHELADVMVVATWPTKRPAHS
jgi:hypothetical protein